VITDLQGRSPQSPMSRITARLSSAYLPLGFVSGLFSINHATFMDNATNAVYAVLTVIFLVGTYGLALSLETIMEQWISFKSSEWRPKPRRHKNPDLEVELPSWRERNPLTLRRSYEVGEEVSSSV
jgi:hypothetical protein